MTFSSLLFCRKKKKKVADKILPQRVSVTFFFANLAVIDWIGKDVNCYIFCD